MKRYILNHLNLALGAAIVGLMGCATTHKVKNDQKPVTEDSAPAEEQQSAETRPIMVKYGVPPSVWRQAVSDTTTTTQTPEPTTDR